MKNLYLYTLRSQHIYSSEGCITACGVCIIGKHYIPGVPLKQACLILSQCCSQRRTHIADSVLIKGNNIHISLHQDGIAFFTHILLGNVKCIDVVFFLKDSVFRGIKVLRHCIAYSSASKAYYLAAGIYNRENNPISELVIIFTVFFGNQTKFQQNFFVCALGFKVLIKAVPAFVSITYSEFL